MAFSTSWSVLAQCPLAAECDAVTASVWGKHGEEGEKNRVRRRG